MAPRFFSKNDGPLRPLTSAVIAAAGSGTRMGEGVNKQFLMLGDVPVLGRTLNAFEEADTVDEIIVVTREDCILPVSRLVRSMGFTKVCGIVRGSGTRQQSVAEGLRHISDECEFVAVHDGARPLVSPEDIERVCRAAYEDGAAAIGVRVKDTLKLVDKAGFIQRTADRSQLWAVQTPQVFSLSMYRAALADAVLAGTDYTDDCQLVERRGGRVRMVEGSYRNIKITTPEDVAYARLLLGMETDD